jgi:hypothetical protein
MKSAEDVHSAVMAIAADRRIAAGKSAYDWKVCVQAVEAAADVIGTVPVSGSPGEYHDAVLSRLRELLEDYYDPDGEYTSGKSEIGTIVSGIESLANGFAGRTG